MTNTDLLLRRTAQMHAALAAGSSSDLENIKSTIAITEKTIEIVTEFSGDLTDAQLHNMAELLIANIASMKDHLKKWCAANNPKFDAEALLGNKDAAALIHDLWNNQKHGGLSKKPRSSYNPCLANARRMMTLSTGSGSSGSASVMLGFGRPTVKTSNGGAITFVLNADIRDEAGALRDMLCDVAPKAIAIWEQALGSAGVPIT